MQILNRSKYQKQKGISLFETILSIGILSIALASIVSNYYKKQEIINDRNMGSYLNELGSYLQEYINQYKDYLIKSELPSTDGSCSGSICTLSTSSTSNFSRFLPNNYLSGNPWYRNSNDQNIQFKIITVGTVPYFTVTGYVIIAPNVMKYTNLDDQLQHLSNVVSSAGMSTGAVYPSSTNVVGYNNLWSANLSSTLGMSLPVTTIVSKTNNNLPDLGKYLRLDGANSMQAALNMGGSSGSESDMVNISSISSNGTLNAPTVQFATLNIENSTLNLSGGANNGLNFLQNSTNMNLGSIWADGVHSDGSLSNGGTQIVGPNFFIDEGFTSGSETYVENALDLNKNKMNLNNFYTWGNMYLNDGTFNLSNAQIQSLFITYPNVSDSNRDINGSTTNYNNYGDIRANSTFTLGSDGNGIANTTYANLTSLTLNVSNFLTSHLDLSLTGNLAVDNINQQTWSNNPVDVTGNNNQWSFNNAVYIKNLHLTPQGINEGNGCNSGSIESNSIGAVLYCKNGVWVSGWHQ